jgi:hypothetical protein
MSAPFPSVIPEPGLSAAGDSFVEWQRGVTEFTFLRLNRNLQCCQDFMNARTPAELQKVQQDWALQFSSDYQREIRRQMELLAAAPATSDEVQETAALVA